MSDEQLWCPSLLWVSRCSSLVRSDFVLTVAPPSATRVVPPSAPLCAEGLRRVCRYAPLCRSLNAPFVEVTLLSCQSSFQICLRMLTWDVARTQLCLILPLARNMVPEHAKASTTIYPSSDGSHVGLLGACAVTLVGLYIYI